MGTSHHILGIDPNCEVMNEIERQAASLGLKTCVLYPKALVSMKKLENALVIDLEEKKGQLTIREIFNGNDYDAVMRKRTTEYYSGFVGKIRHLRERLIR